MNVVVDGLKFIRSDATNLNEIASQSIESISSLHAAEHFGLGRYGDPIDVDACFKVMQALQRVLKPEGRLYFSVPIGREDIVYYNSHRQFKPVTILDVFDELELIDFSIIHDYTISTYGDNIIRNGMCEIHDYDCGLFIFKRC